MDEYAMTSLSLMPVELTWEEFKQKLKDFDIKCHLKPTLSETITILTTRNTKIVRNSAFQFLSKIRKEMQKDDVLWYRHYFDITIGSLPTTLHFLFSEVAQQASQLEVRFESRVHDGLFGRHNKEFNPDFKKNLMDVLLHLVTFFDSEGFSFKMVDEVELRGAANEEAIRDYIEIGNRWFGSRHRYIFAGLKNTCLKPSQFDADEEGTIQPSHYVYRNFYIYDRAYGL